MWQDIVLLIVNILLSYSLIPQVYKGFKKKKALISLQTSIISSVGLGVISIAYWSLGLFFSTLFCVINSIFWFSLFIQGIIYRD